MIVLAGYPASLGLQNEYIFSAVHDIFQTFKIFTPKIPPTPPVGWGLNNFVIDFLGSSWHFPDFWIFDPLKSPLAPPGVEQFFLDENESRIYPNMCQIWLRSDGRVKKNGGTDRQTDIQTDKGTLQLSIVLNTNTFITSRSRRRQQMPCNYHAILYQCICHIVTLNPDKL